MNRPKTALAAVLMTILAAVPATAQQAPLTLQPSNERILLRMLRLPGVSAPRRRRHPFQTGHKASGHAGAHRGRAAESDRGTSAGSGCLCQAVSERAYSQQGLAPMIMHDNLLPAEAVRPNASQLLRSAFSSLAQRIADWITTAADYYEAAAMYEQLSKLSNAELQRRGLSRATLARDVCDACGSTAER